MDHAAYYRALTARDPRFDGVFFVGVTSTGIYCRPICTAKTPQAKNCRFYSSAEAAESDSFRPCLRCRPELAPGSAPVDDARRIADLLVQRLEEGMYEAGIESIAAQFELSSRQIRRIIRQELGVSPIQLLSTRRLLLAKQLLTETRLPIIEVAFASGFSSLRRFNDAFRERYGMPPSRLRREASIPATNLRANETLTLQLSYRPPFDWRGLLHFLAQRELKGVEQVAGDEYRRTVRLGSRQGWFRVFHVPKKRGLAV
ncbi:MAG TPA: Ada metal-binding domain-containing protein, partial [bacterium]|nr:Ada metal-binding domain-containing protein [bacterium]